MPITREWADMKAVSQDSGQGEYNGRMAALGQ